MKRALCLLLALLLVTILPVSAQAAETATIRRRFEATGTYMESLGAPVAGGLGGEWMVLGFARSGRVVADSYYDSVVAYVEEKIDENGRLHATKCTSNCRFIVSLTALGKDVTNVGGHNLLSGLNDLNYIKKVGVSGVIWTLIAFDCGGYEMPQGIDRTMLVDAILDYRTSGGGWANAGDISDPDVTSMAIQALAPYRESDPQVKAAIDTAVELLSEMQDSTGNFPSQYGSSSETISQIIVALSTLGIDANSDERFVKDGVSALDGLLSYYVEEGGFCHVQSGKRDGMATEQGYYALTAYLRMLEGKTPLYDMADVFHTTPQEPEAPPLPDETQKPEELPPVQKEQSYIWVGVVLGIGVALMVLCIVFKKKLGKRKSANVMMVVIILTVASLGVGLALQLRQVGQSELGSRYHITEIPGNQLFLSENPQNSCTISICCDTVLDNLKQLESGKVAYVPKDGVILQKITVEFTPGETVFDVLRRVCQAADIPLEYSWTPLYDSYYLEGINHLYEYDCGTESGWMYQVNETFPNYGCSSYEVKDGDEIQWRYSCIGTGTDLDTENTAG